MAAQEGHVEIVELLLKNGADVDAKDMVHILPKSFPFNRIHH